MNANEQRSHDFALMMIKVTAEASINAERLNGSKEININSSDFLDSYIDIYNKALNRLS